MSHELAFVGGEAQMFYSKVGGSPWHSYGVEIDGQEQFDWEGVMARHFDEWKYHKLPYSRPEHPLAAPAPGQPEPVYVKGRGAFYVWCETTRKELGNVGGAYEVVNNREAFEVLKPLVDSHLAALETGGVLRDGADAWLLVRWNLERFGPDVREVFEKDGGIQPYSTVMANHSGRRPILLGNTPIRVVCANTLGQAECDAGDVAGGRGSERWRAVPHKQDAKSRLVEVAQDLFHGIVERYEVIARAYRLLMQTRLDDEAFTRMVLDVVAPDPRLKKDWNPEAKLAGVVLERFQKKRAHLRHLWVEGKGHTGEKNCWYAYNATVEALDYNKDLWPSRSGVWRAASLLTGELAAMKNTVLDRLTGFAQQVAA
jgi:phage/plasmid-like protein (TIGR03299 family)